MVLRDKLKENASTFLKSAKLVYQTGDYTSSTILYCKAIFALMDLEVLRRFGMLPKDHTERFNILKSQVPDLYAVLDRIFPYYLQTYSRKVEQAICDEVKTHAERLAGRP